MQCLPISPAWAGEPCIVAASGPSLTREIASRIRMLRWLNGWRVLVVNDAYRLMPWADVLYAADWSWWKAANGAPEFQGERWSCHSRSVDYCDDKSEVFQVYGLRLVEAADGKGFSSNPERIHYGAPGSSGFQALNAAILLGAQRIVLVGYDMRHVGGKSHFFGDHVGLRNAADEHYRDMCRAYAEAPDGVEIVNATPGSALTRYPLVDFDDATNDRVHRHRAVAHA